MKVLCRFIKTGKKKPLNEKLAKVFARKGIVIILDGIEKEIDIPEKPKIKFKRKSDKLSNKRLKPGLENK